MTEGNGLSNKELLLRVWDEVKEHRAETTLRFDRVETRIDSLEADRDKSFFPRKWGGIAATAVLTTGIGAIVGMAVVR